MATPLTLVLGGTGKTGRRVAQRLAARGLPVRLGSRTGHPPFDWEDRRTWEPALHGVAQAYVSYQPDLAVPGADATVAAFAAQAARSGVQRLVLLSGRGEDSAQRAEEAVQECSTAWTILRASWFSQNFSEGSFLPLVRSGEVALPAGDVPEPFVDADDIADVAVAALTQQGHAGQVYELTGPRLLTFAQVVAEIAQAAGRPVRYEPVAMSGFTSALADQGEPAEVVALLAYLFSEVLDGRNAHVADGVQRALGRAPRDFGEHVRVAAQAGVWSDAPLTSAVLLAQAHR